MITSLSAVPISFAHMTDGEEESAAAAVTIINRNKLPLLLLPLLLRFLHIFVVVFAHDLLNWFRSSEVCVSVRMHGVFQPTRG